MNKLLRLGLMGRDEIAWRARAAGRTQAQRVAVRLRPPKWDRRQLKRALSPSALEIAGLGCTLKSGDWPQAHCALAAAIRGRPSRFALDHRSPNALIAAIVARWPDAIGDAAARADRVLAGQYDLLGYHGLSFARDGHQVDWHLDPVHNRKPPMRFWAEVPYLDPAIGDHKIIWELSRHQHWLQLGRALWLTGDGRYARGIVDQLESWIQANPPLLGLHWASMLEVGLRAISWTWALHFLLADGGGPRDDGTRSPWLVDLLLGLDRQLAHVEHNLSYYFSPNTHLTGEALALYVVGHALPELEGSQRWIHKGRKILLEEIGRQIHADGGHAEGSTHYHRYTLDIYLLALIAASRAGDEQAASRFAEAVTRLADFARSMADDNGALPLLGDDDGGMLWPITGRACDDLRDSLAIAAVLLRRPDFAPWPVPEEAFWIGGKTTIDAAPAVEEAGRAEPLPRSRTFADSGYVVARDPNGDHAVFDVGRHGYRNAGHAHADALALTLGIAGLPMLVDPGTATYTMDPPLRDLMRSTRSHNTVVLDGRSQSEPAGPFHWRTRVDARLHASRHNPAFDWIQASHAGYAPRTHQRTLFRAAGSGWLVVDEFLGSGRSSARACWHFDARWMATVDAPRRLCLRHENGSIAWLTYDEGTVRLERGNQESGLGWTAPVYGTLIPAWSAELTHEGNAPFRIVTWIGVTKDDHPPILEVMENGNRTDGESTVICLCAGDRRSVFATRSGRSSSTMSGLGAPQYETDACALHYRTDKAGTFALDLAGASFARSHCSDWLSLETNASVADLHVAVAGCALEIASYEPPAELWLKGAALDGVSLVRLNGQDIVPLASATSSAIQIRREHWPSSSARSS